MRQKKSGDKENLLSKVGKSYEDLRKRGLGIKKLNY